MVAIIREAESMSMRMRSPRVIEVLASQDIHGESMGLIFNPSENRHKKIPQEQHHC